MADEATADKGEAAASNGTAAKGKTATKTAKAAKGTKSTKTAKAAKSAKPKASKNGAPKGKGASKGKSKAAAKKETAAKEVPAKKIKMASEDLPRRTLSESLPVTEALRSYANKTASWEEIAQVINVNANNPQQKYPLWAAVAYGLIKADGDQYTMAEVGRKIIAPQYEGEDQEGKLKAILTPRVMSQFYTDYNDLPLPAENILTNVLVDRYSIPRERVTEARNILLTNAREVGILRPDANGGEAFRFSATAAPPKPQEQGGGQSNQGGATLTDAQPRVQPDSCFVVTPIGDEGTPERKHADAIFKHLIKPVLDELKIEAQRADKISKPGIINKQIITHLAYSKLCIADLSFNNPNAFYEMGVRHAFKLPMIQIIRKGDKIPFDVGAGRTIQIDCSDPYSVMDAFTSARKELKEHVESVLNGNVTQEDEPMTIYLPGLKVTIPPLGGA